MCPAEGMQAGISLASTLLLFSSGSCETEKIVSSEIDVSGTFIFPGKNPCPVATVTTPWPCTPATLGLGIFTVLFPMLFPALLIISPEAPILLTQSGSSFQGCSTCLPLASHDGRVWVLGGERMESDPAPHLRGLPSQAAPVGPRAISPLPLLPGHREIHVIDTDYEQYAILRLSLHWQGKDFHVLKYFSKCTLGWGAGPAGALLGMAQPSPAPLRAPQRGAWRTSMDQASGDSAS